MPSHTDYLALGWSTIPAKSDKTPRGKWAEFSAHPPTPEQASEWDKAASAKGEEWPQLAVVCGAVSGIVVVDVDDAAGWEYLKQHKLSHTLQETVCACSTPQCEEFPHGKYHFYFKHPGGIVRCLPKAGPGNKHGLPGIDVKADGGYVLAPNSLHKRGHRYEWVHSPFNKDVELRPLPEWILAKLSWEAAPGVVRVTEHDQLPPDTDWVAEALQGAAEGTRDNNLTRLVGHWFGIGLDRAEVLQMALMANSRNAPPLSEVQVHKIVNSIGRKESTKPKFVPVELPECKYSREWHDKLPEALAAISSILNVNVFQIKKLTGTDPKIIFIIEHESRKIEYTPLELLNQSRFRAKFAGETNVVPKHFSTKPDKQGKSHWDGFVQSVYDAAEIVDAGEDATQSGELKRALADYLAGWKLEDCTAKVPPSRAPFTIERETYLYLQEFVSHVRNSLGLKIDKRSLAQQMKLLGCTPEQLAHYGSRAFVWKIAPRLVPEQVFGTDEREEKAPPANEPEGEMVVH